MDRAYIIDELCQDLAKGKVPYGRFVAAPYSAEEVAKMSSAILHGIKVIDETAENRKKEMTAYFNVYIKP